MILIEKKKMGRPTTSPKTKSRQIRLDEECNKILEEYCKQEGIIHSEAIRRGIKKLKEDIKK